MTSQNVKVDVYDSTPTVGEYLQKVNSAKGPEELYIFFLEAKKFLKPEEYKVFRKATVSHFNLLIECGAMLTKDF